MHENHDLLEVINIQTAIAQKGRNLEGIMGLVVDKTAAIAHADGAAIELAEEGDMVYRAVSGIAEGNLGLRLNMRRSMSGLSVLSGETLHCDDSEMDPRADRDACRKIGLRSMIIVPLNFDGETVGVLKVMSRERAHFSRKDSELLLLISGLVGASIHHAVHQSQDDLFYMATHDHLTGLANRALFMDRLRKQIAQCLREKSNLGVLIVDMDGLKEINDAHGHRTGSAVIKEFSRRALASARNSDTFARLGGDEFGMILNNAGTPEGVSAAAERLRSALKAPFLFEGRSFTLRASMGGAIFPEDSRDLDNLLELADQRMYVSKRERKKSHSSRPG